VGYRIRKITLLGVLREGLLVLLRTGVHSCLARRHVLLELRESLGRRVRRSAADGVLHPLLADCDLGEARVLRRHGHAPIARPSRAPPD
jgi:hypothetical protein